MKRTTAWWTATAMLLAGGVAATAGAQNPPAPLPPPGPDAPAPYGSGSGALPPAAPPPATAQPPGYPPGPPQQGYPPGYAPPGYYPGYPPPQGYYPPGYGYPGYGQPAYGPPPPYAYGYPAPPPYVPPPPEERGVHLHDGFYMRLAIGFGSLAASIEPEEGTEEATLSGTGLALDFGFGGAIADGFILGGRMAVAESSNPDLEVAGTTQGTDGTMSMGGLQFFADIYPWADGGLHVLAGFGPGFFSYDPSPGNETYAEERDSSSASGYCATVGVGWEGWVGSQWAIGGMFNLNWGQFEDDVSVTSYDTTGNATTMYAQKSKLQVLAPNLTFTATFN